jgi:hypothetical protein
VVLGSGSSGLGEWRQETVNFAQDYEALFGQSSSQVQGIGLLTSSSFTKSIAVADYDDFLLLNSEALLAETSAQRSVLQTPITDSKAQGKALPGESAGKWAQPKGKRALQSH